MKSSSIHFHSVSRSVSVSHSKNHPVQIRAGNRKRAKTIAPRKPQLRCDLIFCFNF